MVMGEMRWGGVSAYVGSGKWEVGGVRCEGVPGATLASMMVILRSGRDVARWYAQDRPALPAPMMTTSEMARSYIRLKYLGHGGAASDKFASENETDAHRLIMARETCASSMGAKR